MTSDERKATPVYSGVMKYFPLALAAVAQLSKFGNDKHNPGEPLHWSREKSNDHLDCIARHLLEAGTVDPEDGRLHDVKLAWRALANLETALEARAPMQVLRRCIPPGDCTCKRFLLSHQLGLGCISPYGGIITGLPKPIDRTFDEMELDGMLPCGYPSCPQWFMSEEGLRTHRLNERHPAPSLE